MRRADGPEAGKRVLIVDDNMDAAETMSVLVDNLGYVTSTAFDGYAALEAIKNEQPDLVLMDIGLPGLSGVEVAQRVRREVANPPALIAVTGYGQASDRDTSFDAGFYAHLTKPIDVRQLESLLGRLLDKP